MGFNDYKRARRVENADGETFAEFNRRLSAEIGFPLSESEDRAMDYDWPMGVLWLSTLEKMQAARHEMERVEAMFRRMYDEYVPEQEEFDRPGPVAAPNKVVATITLSPGGCPDTRAFNKLLLDALDESSYSAEVESVVVVVS